TESVRVIDMHQTQTEPRRNPTLFTFPPSSLQLLPSPRMSSRVSRGALQYIVRRCSPDPEDVENPAAHFRRFLAGVFLTYSSAVLRREG
ncbi:hypothetical protein K443DRAFT_113932, partial [Laccaria amethystina LaAM-08-1]